MIQVRAALPDDVARIAEIQILSWRATYRDILAEAYLARLDIAAHAIQWQRSLDRGAVVFVAEGDGEVVGFAAMRDDEITVLYLDPRHQRRGFGRQLLARCLERARASGHAGVWLWVLRDNAAARSFYAACGGEAREEQAITVGGQKLVQVRYVWPFQVSDA